MSFLSIIAVASVALCGLMYATQRSQIYFPTAETPYANPSAQTVRLESQGERLNVWVVPRGGSLALIYFGGNAEDVAGNLDAFFEAFPEHTLYLANYRGYGGSSGRPSEPGLFADALVLYDHVRAAHSDISVMGRSLGSSVAVYLASQRPVARLVLVTAFDSLVNVAREHFWWLPVRLLLRDRYDSTSRAREVTAPVLVVVAGEDEIISRVRSEALAAAFAPGQVQVRVVPSVTHNTLDLAPEYLGAVRAFLEQPQGDSS